MAMVMTRISLLLRQASVTAVAAMSRAAVGGESRLPVAAVDCWRRHWWERRQGQDDVMMPAFGIEGAMGGVDTMEEQPQQLDDHRGDTIGGILSEGFMLMAVPKKKASHRRQRRRLVNYDVENVQLYTCPACNKPRTPHRLCNDYEKCAKVGLARHRGAEVGQEEKTPHTSIGEAADSK